jgi:hypothetical protein
MINFDPSLLRHFLDSAATVPTSITPKDIYKPIRIENITSDKRESLKKNQKISSTHDKTKESKGLSCGFPQWRTKLGSQVRWARDTLMHALLLRQFTSPG